MYIIHNFHVVKIVIILHSSVCHDYLFTKKLKHEITIRNNKSQIFLWCACTRLKEEARSKIINRILQVCAPKKNVCRREDVINNYVQLLFFSDSSRSVRSDVRWPICRQHLGLALKRSFPTNLCHGDQSEHLGGIFINEGVMMSHLAILFICRPCLGRKKRWKVIG